MLGSTPIQFRGTNAERESTAKAAETINAEKAKAAKVEIKRVTKQKANPSDSKENKHLAFAPRFDDKPGKQTKPTGGSVVFNMLEAAHSPSQEAIAPNEENKGTTVGAKQHQIATLKLKKAAFEKMRAEVKFHKVKLDAKKQSKDQLAPFEIEFLEINYRYLDLISNNNLKKARRKLSKTPRSKMTKKEIPEDGQSFENGDLEFEYQVMMIAITMEENNIERKLQELEPDESITTDD